MTKEIKRETRDAVPSYAYYLIRADKCLRMAYHHSEIKNFDACFNDLTEVITYIRLAVGAIKLHVESDLTKRKSPPQ
jgi:hypothetical protein